VLVGVENINDVGVSRLDNVVIDHYFVFVNNNRIVSSIVTALKDIQYVLGNLVDIIIVPLRLQLGVAPGQRLLLRAVEGDEAVLRVPGRGLRVAAHRDHVRLPGRQPRELRRRGRGAAVPPVRVLRRRVAPVGDGAADGAAQQRRHGVQHGAEVHLDAGGRGLGRQQRRGDTARHRAQQTAR